MVLLNNSVSMVDWTTGFGNKRYWALKMIADRFGRGGKNLYKTEITT